MNDSLFAHIQAAMPGPERPFLDTTSRRYTYGDLDLLSAALGHRLQALGIEKGDRVAVQVEKSPQAVFLYLACLRIGAVYLPLNTGYTLHELDYFFADAEPRVIVCDPARESDVAALAGARAVVTLDAEGAGSLMDGAGGPAELEPVGCAADDLAALLYTSGTTGHSKGAMLTHRNLASNALALRQTWGFTGTDALLHVLPIYHTHGLFVAINTVLLAGARMLFLPRFDPDAVIPALAQATVMMGVPTYYSRLLARADFTAAAARAIRVFISGSAPLLEETFVAFEERTGQRILERYGMTETGMNTSNPLHGERRPGTVGLPLPGVEVRAADDDGRPLARGEVGILEVRGPNVFEGYWRMPEKTAEEFRADGFFITGDVGVIGEDGYVSIVGRAKDLVISGGLNVYPKEIERLIDALPGVVESAVVGLPHPDFGEAVAAVVVRHADAAIGEGDIITAARAELAPFKVPKKVFFVETLPRNSMGKVQKNVLRADYGATFTQASSMAPRPPLERLLQDRLDQAVRDDPAVHGGILRVDAPGWAWQGAAGLADPAGLEMRPDDLFQAASITKMLTATTFMTLVEAGLAGLDVPIGRWLPVSMTEGLLDERVPCTTRHLLAHTSGIADFFGEGEPGADGVLPFVAKMREEPDRLWDPRDILAWTKSNLRPHFPPGEGWHYADTGYVLVGLIIEAIGGSPLHQAMRERVLKPLGMDHAYMLFREPARPSLPGRQPSVAYAGDAPYGAQRSVSADWAGGGLVVTAADLARFLRAFADDRIFADPGTRRQMLTWTATGEPGVAYGLGVRHFVLAELGMPGFGELWGHTGFLKSFMLYWPEGDAVLCGTLNQSAAKGAFSRLRPVAALVPAVLRDLRTGLRR